MVFYRIKAEGIAHNSYFIGSDNSAAVIDPRRDCRIYLDLSQQQGMNVYHKNPVSGADTTKDILAVLEGKKPEFLGPGSC